MLSKIMSKALNEQVTEEMNSSYIYSAMSAWLKSQNYDGMAHWFSVQSHEEWGHAKKIKDFVFQQRGRVILEGLKKPQIDWKSPLDVFHAGFAHEQHITKCFDNLVATAQKEKDNATQNFLQWFVSEQVEEEANFDGIIAKLKMIGDHPGSMFMMDKILGERA
jgi:ferritin